MAKLLILGGTVFLGRHVVDAALVAGCEVTLLNRGTRNLQFTQPVERLRGDRDGDLNVLQGRHFDETAPVTAAVDGYGGAKTRAEEAIELAMPGRVSIVRHGLIAGPYDLTGPPGSVY